MGFGEATGTPDELARVAALFTMYLNYAIDYQDKQETEKDIKAIWEEIQKRGKEKWKCRQDLEDT